MLHLDDYKLLCFENVQKLDHVRPANKALQDIGLASDYIDLLWMEDRLIDHLEGVSLTRVPPSAYLLWRLLIRVLGMVYLNLIHIWRLEIV